MREHAEFALKVPMVFSLLFLPEAIRLIREVELHLAIFYRPLSENVSLKKLSPPFRKHLVVPVFEGAKWPRHFYVSFLLIGWDRSVRI